MQVFHAGSSLCALNRFVLVLAKEHNYFFWLYIAYGAFEVYLALLACSTGRARSICCSGVLTTRGYLVSGFLLLLQIYLN